MASAQHDRLYEPGALQGWQHSSMTQAGVSPVLQQPKPRCGSLTPVIRRRKTTWSTASCSKVSTAPEGDTSRALPPVSPDPKPPLHTQRLLLPGLGRGSAQLRKRRIDTAWRGRKGAGWGWIRYSQLELPARCEFLTCTLCREAFREQGRRMGTAVGLQPQTVSKWVSICLSTQSAGRITPTAQSHHGSYPHRRRREGRISEKRLSLMCQSNKKKPKKRKTCSFAALSSLLE